MVGIPIIIKLQKYIAYQKKKKHSGEHDFSIISTNVAHYEGLIHYNKSFKDEPLKFGKINLYKPNTHTLFVLDSKTITHSLSGHELMDLVCLTFFIN